jgi:hypothetical protein
VPDGRVGSSPLLIRVEPVDTLVGPFVDGSRALRWMTLTEGDQCQVPTAIVGAD